MNIAVAGPYSASTAEGRASNLRALNAVAAQLWRLGHVPVIGVNAALPVVDQLPPDADRYEAIMSISMVAISACDSLLLTAESPGANRERDHFLARGLPVFYSVKDVPFAG